MIEFNEDDSFRIGQRRLMDAIVERWARRRAMHNCAVKDILEANTMDSELLSSVIDSASLNQGEINELVALLRNDV